MHADQLGSTAVVTDASSTVVETLDYFAYGGLRINTGTNATDRTFIGERYDASTNLNYFNARYYEGTRGQFLSQDPVHLAIGNPDLIKKYTGREFQNYLSDPQQLNSYSYGRGNPISNKDPSGNGVFQGSASVGWWLGGGVVNVNIGNNPVGGQIEIGPSLGPSIGGMLSGSYDPSASLDSSGFYFQVSAGGALGVGTNYSSQAPLTWKDGKFSTSLPSGRFAWAVGLYGGVTDSVTYKASPLYLSGYNQSRPHSIQSSSNSSANQSGDISQLSNSVVAYANTPDANTKDPGFAAALKALNMYNTNSYYQAMPASTPQSNAR